VVLRRRELGIRIALGATPGTVSWSVLREGLLLAGTGIVAGTAAALALSRLIQGLLYGVESTDAATLVAVVIASLGAASLACYWPAHRATRVDPLEVLRAE
jgi:ABC-type antimicrobial peptide transport system permease subunit